MNASIRLLLLPVLALSTACSDYNVITDDDGSVDLTDDTGEDGEDEEVEEEDTSMWDGASLVVDSPQSGDVLPLDDDSTFAAHIVGADGETMDFDDIAWASDIDTAWQIVGSSVEDKALTVGAHTLTVQAELPNGNVLTSSLYPVRVQHEDAGIYTGSIIVDLIADYDGTEYTASCIGSVTMIVDAEGETALGDSNCLLSLLGYELETAYEFDLELDDGEVSGDAIIDVFGWTELDLDAEGEVGGGELGAEWEGSLMGFADLAGTMDTVRVSLDTELPD